MDEPRRRLLKAGLALPALYAPRGWAAPAPGPTPSCGEEPTASQTAGPFYTPDSPARRALRADDPSGTPVDLHVAVLDTQCRPLAGAVVDLWHADSGGRYDNEGFRLRGHQRVDAQGAASFETVLPGVYPGRTRHYHVRLFGPQGGRLLTTQLYFPGEQGNGEDGLFEPDLLLDVAQAGKALVARYTLIVKA